MVSIKPPAFIGHGLPNASNFALGSGHQHSDACGCSPSFPQHSGGDSFVRFGNANKVSIPVAKTSVADGLKQVRDMMALVQANPHHPDAQIKLQGLREIEQSLLQLRASELRTRAIEAQMQSAAAAKGDRSADPTGRLRAQLYALTQNRAALMAEKAASDAGLRAGLERMKIVPGAADFDPEAYPQLAAMLQTDGGTLRQEWQATLEASDAALKAVLGAIPN